MKVISILFSRVISYYKKNKLIFTLYILGTVTSALVFIYFYGNMVSSKLVGTSEDYAYRRYYLELAGPTAIDAKDLDWLSPYDPVFVQLQSQISLQDIQVQEGNITFVTDDGSPRFLTADMADAPFFSPVKGENDFTKAGKKEGAWPIVLPQVIQGSNQEGVLGSKLTVKGKGFYLLGINVTAGDCYIPYSAFKELGLPTDRVSILLNKRLSREESSAFAGKLAKTFPLYTSLTDPIRTQAEFEKGFGKELAIVIVLYALSMVTFLFIMQFMVVENRYENAIYTIVGASKGDIATYILLETALLFLFSGLCAVGIHKLLYGQVFEKINRTAGIVYTGQDYILLVGFMILVSALITVPMLAGNYRTGFTSLPHRKGR